MTSFDWVLGIMLGMSVLTYADAFGFGRARTPKGPDHSTTPQKIWVFQSDGALGCNEDRQGNPVTPIPLEVAEKKLTSNKVAVFHGLKAGDGRMHTQDCGSDKGTRNYFLIDINDSGKASGFEVVKDEDRKALEEKNILPIVKEN